MKTLLSKILTGTALGVWFVASANAADVQCPNPAVERYMVLTNVVSGVTCWDYGPGNDKPNNNSPVIFNNPDSLELGPLGWTTIDLYAATDTGPYLIDLTGNGGTSGTFFSQLTSSSGAVLSFKFGDGQDDPDWFAFYFPANSIISGGWEFLCTASATTCKTNGLSHVKLYGNEGDEYLVPIPAAAWLLGSGLLGLLAIGRRRKLTPTAA